MARQSISRLHRSTHSHAWTKEVLQLRRRRFAPAPAGSALELEPACAPTELLRRSCCSCRSSSSFSPFAWAISASNGAAFWSSTTFFACHVTMLCDDDSIDFVLLCTNRSWSSCTARLSLRSVHRRSSGSDVVSSTLANLHLQVRSTRRCFLGLQGCGFDRLGGGVPARGWLAEALSSIGAHVAAIERDACDGRVLPVTAGVPPRAVVLRVLVAKRRHPLAC